MRNLTVEKIKNSAAVTFQRSQIQQNSNNVLDEVKAI